MNDELTIHKGKGTPDDDSLYVARWNTQVHIAIDEPWAGDTESGFGLKTSIDLTLDEAKVLSDWLVKVLADANA